MTHGTTANQVGETSFKLQSPGVHASSTLSHENSSCPIYLSRSSYLKGIPHVLYSTRLFVPSRGNSPTSSLLLSQSGIRESWARIRANAYRSFSLSPSRMTIMCFVLINLFHYFWQLLTSKANCSCSTACTCPTRSARSLSRPAPP